MLRSRIWHIHSGQRALAPSHGGTANKRYSCDPRVAMAVVDAHTLVADKPLHIAETARTVAVAISTNALSDNELMLGARAFLRRHLSFSFLVHNLRHTGRDCQPLSANPEETL